MAPVFSSMRKKAVGDPIRQGRIDNEYDNPGVVPHRVIVGEPLHWEAAVAPVVIYGTKDGA